MTGQGTSDANSRLTQNDVVGSGEQIESESDCETLIVGFARYRSFGGTDRSGQISMSRAFLL
jgi:hypothetical protein